MTMLLFLPYLGLERISRVFAGRHLFAFEPISTAELQGFQRRQPSLSTCSGAQIQGSPCSSRRYSHPLRRHPGFSLLHLAWFRTGHQRWCRGRHFRYNHVATFCLNYTCTRLHFKCILDLRIDRKERHLRRAHKPVWRARKMQFRRPHHHVLWPAPHPEGRPSGGPRYLPHFCRQFLEEPGDNI